MYNRMKKGLNLVFNFGDRMNVKNKRNYFKIIFQTFKKFKKKLSPSMDWVRLSVSLKPGTVAPSTFINWLWKWCTCCLLSAWWVRALSVLWS